MYISPRRMVRSRSLLVVVVVVAAAASAPVAAPSRVLDRDRPHLWY